MFVITNFTIFNHDSGTVISNYFVIPLVIPINQETREFQENHEFIYS